MMKKEYITPEGLLRRGFTEGVMQTPASLPLVDNPDPEPEWGDEESRENNKSFDVWED